MRAQGDCGSCWTYAITAVAEVALAKKIGDTNPQHLSPQSLLDCASGAVESTPVPTSTRNSTLGQ